jgi:hypothetical protein
MKMFFEFPREIGFPKRFLVRSLDEFKQLINQFLNKTDLYTSVYSFEKVDGLKPIYSTAKVDKVFFDFDGAESFNDFKSLHEKLMKFGILHTMFFSGGGFHMYVFVKMNNNFSEEEKKRVLTKISNILAKGFDEVCSGDLARLTRIPNTFNFKRKRFCIPISSDDLKTDFDEIQKKAKTQQSKFYFYGNKVLNLDGIVERVPIQIFNSNFINGNHLLNDGFAQLPPFLTKILDEHSSLWRKEKGWIDRYLIILWLREIGWSKHDVIEFLERKMTPNEFSHCIFEERQVDYIFSKRRMFGETAYFFPNVEILREWNYELSPKDEEMVNNLYVRAKELV